MSDLLKSLKHLGGPFGICFVAVVALTATRVIDAHGVGVLLAWYVALAGIGYAGRIFIHVFACGYICRHTEGELDSKRRKLRRWLNWLVLLNAVSIAVWAAVSAYLFLTTDSILTRSIVCVALFVGVIGLAVATVAVTSTLGLKRGSEWVCASRFGRGFKRVDRHLPNAAPFSWILPRLKDLTPEDKVSAFVILVSCALLAFPAAGLGGPAVGYWIRGDFPKPQTREAGAFGPLYEDQCANLPLPGTGAPPPQRDELHGLWLGAQGLEGAGSEQAGCTHRAMPVVGQTGVYYAAGYCGSTLRSLGVASPDHDFVPALLYQPAAGFALRLANEGTLIGASRRHSIRTGDFYLIYTSYGSWLLVRSRTTSGDEAKTGGDLPCERVAENNVPYEAVPPGLVDVLEQIASAEPWAWPERVAGGLEGVTEFALRPEGPGANPVAIASCSSPTFCILVANGITYTTVGSLFTTVEAVEEMGR